MPLAPIAIKGARENNLQNIDLVLPRNRLICFTGVSGSGKSSLAYDTLYAEGQRRYVQSLSTYAQQFLDQMPKPDVDQITGLSPAICISQKTGAANPRSTVGTLTEIYDFLRLLYTRVGTFFCPDCAQPIGTQSPDQIIAAIQSVGLPGRYLLLAPVVKEKKGEFRGVLENFLRRGFDRARIDGHFYALDAPPSLDRRVRHRIEVVVAELNQPALTSDRLRETVNLALQLGEGEMVVVVQPEGGTTSVATTPASATVGDALASAEPKELWFSSRYACPRCGQSFPAPAPHLFSFNHPAGACPECGGLGQHADFVWNPDLVVAHLSIKEGAISILGPLETWNPAFTEYFKAWLSQRVSRYNLTLEEVFTRPWKDLPEPLRRHIIFGDPDSDANEPLAKRPTGFVEAMMFQTFHNLIRSGLARAIKEGLHHIKGPGVDLKGDENEAELRQQLGQIVCWACQGERLNRLGRNVLLRSRAPRWAAEPGRNITQLCRLPVTDLIEYLNDLDLEGAARRIAEPILREVTKRLSFLVEVGVGYLTLDRAAPSLAGGEMQRIRLATQLGRRLSGVLYVLDEPSIGLHPRDNERLLAKLKELRDQGNTVVVVEHDEQTIRSADYVVDFGPGAGFRGGRIVATGPVPAIVRHPESITGQYLSGRREIPIPAKRRPPGKAKLVIRGACHNNLKNIDVEIPLGLFVCVTGVSGSGKSSLVNDILVELLRRELYHAETTPGKFQSVHGLQHIKNLVAIDQSPIGRTPRSNPATYTKVFDDIRQLFAELPEAKLRGFKPGRFSFNVAGGRCEACAGNGAQRLDMDFMVDLWITCPVCEGRRFNRETLSVRFKGHSIADVLQMDVAQAMEVFENIPAIRRKLETLYAVGLGYLKLGQPSTTLSGGEAQRIKLSRELVKRTRKGTLYVLDEPTTGLHFADVELLVQLLQTLVDGGSTVLVVEHNLEVIKCADWIIDLGPEGGEAGGYIVAVGTPEEVAQVEASHTGRALREVLGRARITRDAVASEQLPAAALHTVAETGKSSGNGQTTRKEWMPTGKSGGDQSAASSEGETLPAFFAADNDQAVIAVRGAREHNLRDLSVDIPREKLTVLCGPSGSGKTSLAVDTIYAEGRRRYLESLSNYARQFLGMSRPPAVDRIDGLTPAVAIEQKGWGASPRSTVGTMTEIYDYLRVLFARQAVVYCPQCGVPAAQATVDQIVNRLAEASPEAWAYILAPLSLQPGQNSQHLVKQIEALGYQRIRVDGRTYRASEVDFLGRGEERSVEIVIDRLQPAVVGRGRLAESVEAALRIGRGTLRVAWANDHLPEHRWPVQIFSQLLSCPSCQRGFEPLLPQHFSFNSPLGWCPGCHGHGVVDASTAGERLFFDPRLTVREILEETLHLSTNPRLEAMILTICRRQGIPLDSPWGKLSTNARRILLFGTGPRTTYVLTPTPEERAANPQARPAEFQFRGLLAAMHVGERGLEEVFLAEEGSPQRLQKVPCPDCRGSGLRDVPASARWRDRTIYELCQWPLEKLLAWFEAYQPSASEQLIVAEILREIRTRLRFLVEVGLEYLTLSRPMPTLSGGEMQRIRLAAQLGSGLCGVIYVLDEPTIGLHPRDGARLVRALHRLRDLGNTLLVVEHDPQVIEGADYVLDFGPGAGSQGGQIVAAGPPEELKNACDSITGPYLSGRKVIPIPRNRRMPPLWDRLTLPSRARGKTSRNKSAEVRPDQPSPLVPVPEVLLPSPPGGGWLIVRAARKHNLKEIDVRIPLGTLTVVTGVSGSGKTTLVQEVLYRALAHALHHAENVSWADCDTVEGIELVDKVIRVDQRPIGQSPLSVPATYTGVFDLIRQLFAELPEAKVRHLTPRHFSFNHSDGACWNCQGSGRKYIQMHFLPDLEMTCEVCGGKRYNEQVLQVRYRGYTIADVLELPAGEALRLFGHVPPIRRILQTLCDVGLDYLPLGQPAPTLSGGEAQRVKLAAELARPATGRTLYILDEPTTGLHFQDLTKLLEVLQRLVDLGNTVLVIEHNLDLIKVADWVIDLGPEGGERGGYLVAEGTPEDIARFAQLYREQSELRGRKSAAASVKRSNDSPGGLEWRCYTGEYLEPLLANGTYYDRPRYEPPPEDAFATQANLAEWGQAEKPPWEVDGRFWHTVARVDRSGQPCIWEGQLLEAVVDFLESTGKLAEPLWNKSTVVEVYGPGRPSRFFFQAITCERYALRMLFYTSTKVVAESPFSAQYLADNRERKRGSESLKLPQVLIHAPREEWQCVEICAAKLAEIDAPDFWQFVTAAIDGYLALVSQDQSASKRESKKPAQLSRQAVASAPSTGERRQTAALPTVIPPAGRAWHFSPVGFENKQRPQWPKRLLKAVIRELLARGLRPRWHFVNQIRFYPKDPILRKSPIVTLWTKKPDSLRIHVDWPRQGQGDEASLKELVANAHGAIESQTPSRLTIAFRIASLEEFRPEAFGQVVEAACQAWRQISKQP
ncbi:MAG: excinuclease ABC subunit UvrA [Thermoguttaceae bacterium]|nr:excinuclease ABC subunit UvrA [Thermoguttaceae bacterium]MDW8077811.1 excinuclease ABC subunit UvrA [Thermoguttaceae bacterium]